MKYFYAWRNIAIPANAVTVIASIETWMNDSLTAVFIFGWVKIFSTALLITYIHLFRGEIVFFFMNLGISRLKFYASMFAIDMSVFMIITIVIRLIK